MKVDVDRITTAAIVVALSVLGVCVVMIFWSVLTDENPPVTEMADRVVIYSTVDGMPDVGIMCVNGIALAFTHNDDLIRVPELDQKYCDGSEMMDSG